jgi:hypothetical protein
MTGIVQHTSGIGGRIMADGKELLQFRWSDCIDLTPTTCGHGTPIEFDIIDDYPRRRAVNIRRADRFTLTKGANCADR